MIDIILFCTILLIIVLIFVPIICILCKCEPFKFFFRHSEEKEADKLNIYDSIKGLDKPLYKIHYKYLLSPSLRKKCFLGGSALSNYEVLFSSSILEEKEYLMQLFKGIYKRIIHLDYVSYEKLEEFVSHSYLEEIVCSYNSILEIYYRRLIKLNNFIIDEIFNNFIEKESWYYFNKRYDIWKNQYEYLLYPKDNIPYFYKDNFNKIEELHKEFLLNKDKVVKEGFLIDK